MPSTRLTQSSSRLRRAVLALARRLRPVLGRDGLGAAKLSVVGNLHRQGAMTPTALAEREGVKLASLTRPLAELEADGWIDRRVDPADGRRALVSLTASGRRRLAASADAADAVLADTLAALITDAELAGVQQVSALLERIADALQAADPPAGPVKSRIPRAP